MLNVLLNLNTLVNPVRDVTGASSGLFEVVIEFSYPVVA